MKGEVAIVDTAVRGAENVSDLQLAIEIESNLPAVVAPMTLAKKPVLGRKSLKGEMPPLVVKWFEHLKKVSGVKSAQSERTYRNAIEQLYLYFKAQGKDILSVTADDIVLWFAHLGAQKKSASTIQLYATAARLFFSFLCAESLISENPCFVGGVTVKPRIAAETREHKRSDLSLEQVQEILAEMPTDSEMALRNRAIVALMVTSGLRGVEVSEAQCGDMKPKGGYTYLTVRGKGHSEKAAKVKVAKFAEDFIRAYWTVRFNGRYPSDNDFMFVSTSRNHTADTDEQLSTRTIREVCKRAMKEIGLDDSSLTAHSLRHTAATLALSAAVELPDVQNMMRHKNLSTTMIYQHAYNREKNNAEIAIGNLILGKNK